MPMTLRFLSAAAMLPCSVGHAEMTWPPPLSQGSMDKAGTCKGPDPNQVPQNGTCLWFNQGCTIGCPVCVGLKVPMVGSSCGKPGTATLDYRYRTVFNTSYEGDPDFTAEHPWRAPGTAPVWSPCGLAGGQFEPDDGQGTGAWAPTGVAIGFDGRKLPPAPGTENVVVCGQCSRGSMGASCEPWWWLQLAALPPKW